VCRLGASDLDGEALRLFIGWSEAAERPVKGARLGIVGITFNEEVPDLRNSRVRDIVAELPELGFAAFVADPLADPDEPNANARRAGPRGSAPGNGQYRRRLFDALLR
jgi:UDP-N-acetyl-D-mannosaminuronate dehydrogenase